MHEYYKQTKVIVDLVRQNQTGVSFRIFEAMAFEKKVITSNKNIVEYDFYNPANIMLIDEEAIAIDSSFLIRLTNPYLRLFIHIIP